MLPFHRTNDSHGNYQHSHGYRDIPVTCKADLESNGLSISEVAIEFAIVLRSIVS